MTVTDHLQFSVVSAPLAQIDRRALSQAWYSALYGDRAAVEKSSAMPAKTAEQPARKPSGKGNKTSTPTRTARVAITHRAPGSTSVRTGGAETDRRAARSPLARNIERRFLRPGVPPKAATFTVEGDRGRVQILLRESGQRLQLVAICAPSARSYVSDALAQARYALSVRGIRMHAELREAQR